VVISATMPSCPALTGSRCADVRLGGEPVGRWGIALLAVTGVAGLVLGWHGWTTRAATTAPSLAVATATAPASRAGSSAAGQARSPSATAAPAAASPSVPAGSASPGPKLSSEPYAGVAYQVWPGTPSAAARQAMTGLKITVRKQGDRLLVSAGVIGQPASPPHLYVGGARVYVLEASLGDDSGNADYNLGDDGLVVTDAQQRVLP
jgi:hypothetical protein